MVIFELCVVNPVVAYTVGNIVETVVDAKKGFLVEPGSIVALERRTLELLEDYEPAAEMGRIGKDLVAARFSPNRVGHDYESLYSNVIP